MSFLFRRKDKKDEDPEVLAAYNQALKTRRIENAKLAGVRDADRLANQKPFHQKLSGGLQMLAKDIVENAPKTNPEVFFSFDKPKRKRRKGR